MENSKINILFYLVVLFSFVVIFILIKDLNAQKISDFREYSTSLSNIVKQKDEKIKTLSTQNADLENTLTETRNSLDSLSRKIAPPEAVPASVPVTAAK